MFILFSCLWVILHSRVLTRNKKLQCGDGCYFLGKCPGPAEEMSGGEVSYDQHFIPSSNSDVNILLFCNVSKTSSFQEVDLLISGGDLS